MNDTTRIVLIHATRVAMDPVERAFTALWPEADTVSVLDEGLSTDLAAGRVGRSALDKRIVDLADYSQKLGPAAILYTCSAFGRGIEAAARRFDIPVLKPNEAMFEAAIAAGGRATLLYSFAPAAETMEQEFREEAASTGADAEVDAVFVAGALDALKAGDEDTHNRLIAEAARQVTNGTSIMLAHFSMTRAVDVVRDLASLPVLTSPETAIAKLRRQLADAGGTS